MFLLATIAIFAATAPAQDEELDNLEVAQAESEVVFYDDAESEVLESQEIVLIDEESDSENETVFEEN